MFFLLLCLLFSAIHVFLGNVSLGRLHIWFGIQQSVNTNRYTEAKFCHVSEPDHFIFYLNQEKKLHFAIEVFFFVFNCCGTED
jgi:hypothetical protein